MTSSFSFNNKRTYTDNEAGFCKGTSFTINSDDSTFAEDCYLYMSGLTTGKRGFFADQDVSLMKISHKGTAWEEIATVNGVYSTSGSDTTFVLDRTNDPAARTITLRMGTDAVNNDEPGIRAFEGTMQYRHEAGSWISLTTTGVTAIDDLSDVTITSAATNNVLYYSGSAWVNGFTILDEDNMASDSATNICTQQSIKKYVDDQILTTDTLAEVLAIGNSTGGTNIVVTAGDSITVDTISETTGANGVVIDSVTLKDGAVTATGLTLNLTQDYSFTDRSNALTLQGATAATEASLEVYSQDGDGTDDVHLRVVGIGTPGDITNAEYMDFEYDSATTAFKIYSQKTGSGTVRPLSIYTDANTTQLVLNIDGTVDIGGNLGLGANDLTMSGSIGVTGTRVTKGWFTDLEVTNSIAGSITGQAATVATIAGLAPDTATTQATQASITTCTNLVTVGTITTGVWSGTAIEGTAVASTGEGGGTKFLREDGDGTCSWQAAAGGGASRWTALTITTDFDDDPASTSTITMNSDQTGNISPGDQIKFTLGGGAANPGIYYAICSAITSNLLTIIGYPLEIDDGDLTALSYSSTSGIPKEIVIPGNSVVADPLSALYTWGEGLAYLVGSTFTVDTAPTGATLLGNVEVNAADAFSSEVTIAISGTTANSGVTAQSANYDINWGETYAVTVSQIGSTIPGGNALKCLLYFVRP